MWIVTKSDSVIVKQTESLFACADFVKKICNNKGRNIQINETKWSAIMSVQSNQWTAISAFCSAKGWWPTIILNSEHTLM